MTRSVSSSWKGQLAWLRKHSLLLMTWPVLAGCFGRNRPEPSRGPVPRERGEQGLGSLDIGQVYQNAGLITINGPIPVVGSVFFMAGRQPDSILALLSFSLPNRALTFTREGDRYRAVYQVRAEVRQGNVTVRQVETQETVRVAAFKETTRADESIIFQQFFAVVPGQYVLSLAVKDEGSAKTARYETLINVPRLGNGVLATPIPVYEATQRTTSDSVPRLIASPRATAIFGQDSVFPIYLEVYGAAPASYTVVTLTVRGDKNAVLWSDSVKLQQSGQIFSGTANIPISKIGMGVVRLSTASAAGDTSGVPLFVSFGDELPVSTFQEMVGYLRYFASPEKLKTLRDTTPEQRSAVWLVFMRETDPVPSTQINEALHDYFVRIRTANERFREEGGPGWLTDRGMVYVGLGEPDQLYEQGTSDMNQRGRAQVWEYRQFGVQLFFIDQSGFGRWRLTTSSESEFQNLLRRRDQSR